MILAVVLHGYENFSLILREGRDRVFENRMVRRMDPRKRK
jgi:hypothetical protein